MKFTGTLKLNERNAEFLIRAFFKEFNHQSTIQIKGNWAHTEIFFEENPPMEIVDAISRCTIDYFCYAKSEETDADCKTGPNSEAEQDINAGLKDKTEPNSEVVPDSKVQQDGNTVTKTEYGYIPELTNIANNVSSYEMFLTDVISWLNLGIRESDRMREQRNAAFLSMEKAVSEGCDKWKQIKSHATYNTKDRNVLLSAVSKKMQECGYYDIKLLSFLKILVLYRNYDFKSDHITATVNEGTTNECRTSTIFHALNDEEKQDLLHSETKTDIIEGTDTDSTEKTDTDAEAEIIMPCFSEIPWFVDFLKSIDKTKTIEEKVEQVLFKMNLNQPKNTYVKEEILNLTIEAMKKEHIEDMIKLKSWKLRMDFATFLNDFVGEYSTSKVTAKDFLKDLQRAIV